MSSGEIWVFTGKLKEVPTECSQCTKCIIQISEAWFDLLLRNAVSRNADFGLKGHLVLSIRCFVENPILLLTSNSEYLH